MNWKKFKHIALEQKFTIMLLPHSRQKPIHFRLSAWVLGLLGCCLACFMGISIYFACSAADLGGITGRIEELEAEKNRIEAQKQQIEVEKLQVMQENSQLKGSTEQQEQVLRDLEGKTEIAIQELNRLYERENELRAKAGLETVEIPVELAQEASQGEPTDHSQGEPTDHSQGEPTDHSQGEPTDHSQAVASEEAAGGYGDGDQGPEAADSGPDVQEQADNGSGSAEAMIRSIQQNSPEVFQTAPGELLQAMAVHGAVLQAENQEQPALSREAHIVERRLAVFQTEATKKNQNYNELNQVLTEASRLEARRNASMNKRQEIVNYALQFVGNAYVWGGNDPHTGVDCSGFTKYILNKKAGVELPRTAATQYNTGKTIAIDQARPGDLVFYYGGGYINHVAMYIGDGKVVHAASRKSGIKVSEWNYRNPVRIKNVIGD